MSNAYTCPPKFPGDDSCTTCHCAGYPTTINQEMLTNYERILMYNSGAVQCSHEPVLQSMPGFPPTSVAVSSNHVPTSLMQQLCRDPQKWEMLLHAKDKLLYQTKEVVEKQNEVIVDLKRQLKEQSESVDGKLLRRLQDRERDVEHLRLRLETETAAKYEVEKLHRLLGQTEYELEKTEKLLQEILEEKKSEFKKFTEQVSEKSNELERAGKEIKRLEEEKMALKTRIDSLDKYVSDLPTSEDYKRVRKELKYWKTCCSKLKNQMSEQEEKMSTGKKVLEEKAINADRFEKENSNLRQKVKSLQDRMKNDEIHSITLELEDAKFEKERLQADLTKMETLLKEKQRKANAFFFQSQETQKKLEERLTQEEDMVAALREELTKKDFSISELRSSMKQLSTKYQDLVEEKMDLVDNLKQLQVISGKEALETNRKVHKQLRQCLKKVKDIMCMYSQKREGRTLDLSLVLGTAGSANTATNADERSLTDDVNQLTEDINEFRALLADQYAEELADSVNGDCVTH